MKGFNILGKRSEEKTADYFINEKVEDLIERSVSEGKKRKVIEKKVSDECSTTSTTEGIAYLDSISDFSDFPKYVGRGVQELAPDISGSFKENGHSTLLIWYTDVIDEEIKDLKSDIEAAGFKRVGDDYVKHADGKRMSMSVSYSAGKLRIFHELVKED